MKYNKPSRRIPWYCFDVPYEKPSTKGWWKKFQRRWERVWWKGQIRKDDYGE